MIINFTGRRKIRAKDVSIRVVTPADGATMELSVDRLDLGRMDLPDAANVIVEAYDRVGLQRIDVGTVGSRKPLVGVKLADFPSGRAVRVRVKVVGTGDHAGLTLAQSNGLRPELDASEIDADSILPIEPDSSLGELLWELQTAAGIPVLKVNYPDGDWRAFATSQHFMSLVYPEALRASLRWLATELADNDEVPHSADDGDLGAWYYFAAKFGADPSEWGKNTEPEELEAEFSRVVRAFATSLKLGTALYPKEDE